MLMSRPRRLFARTSVFVLATVCLISGNAFGQDAGPSSDQIQKFWNNSESRPDPVILPIRAISAIKDKSGRSRFISENGRYEFKGTFVDKWNEVEVNTYEDAEYSRSHIPLDSLNLKGELLDPLTLGDGTGQTVLAFVSPNGKASRAFLNEIQGLKDEFTFEIFAIPNDNTPRETMVALSCAVDQDRALEALLEGSGYKNLELRPNCSLVKLQNRMIAFGLFGFQAIPSVISPSSLISEGYRPDEWGKFLKENMK
jgi:thiol:disulfide interchange protein DsbC